MRKVLYVCEQHPALAQDAVGRYAAELNQAIGETGEFEAQLVTRGPRGKRQEPGGDGVQHLATAAGEHDPMLGTARRKSLYTVRWRQLLQADRPDVVHYHGARWPGYDAIRETRRTLPDAAIVCTLHDFAPICHHDGLMALTETFELCYEATPRRCHHCFPQQTPQRFFLREQLIKSALEHVDLFIAPSEQLRHRYLEWGLPESKLVLEDYGRAPVVQPEDPPSAGRRRRIGYFGPVNEEHRFGVLREAMSILEQQQAGVTLVRPDDRGPAAAMAEVDWVVVPASDWLGNPFAIQDAFLHRRPVIGADVAGVTERVRDGVDGLLFHRRDRHSLVDTIRRAVGDPDLWDRLRAGIEDPPSLHRHAATIANYYRQLLAPSTGQAAAAVR